MQGVEGRKRTRSVFEPRDEFGGRPRVVHVACDDCDELVKVDLLMLDQCLEQFKSAHEREGCVGWRCTLSSTILHQDPETDASGRQFWMSSMTKACLVGFLTSVRHGNLVVPEGASVSEMLSCFDFQGVPLCAPVGKQNEMESAEPSRGVAFPNRAVGAEARITDIAETVCNALFCWPRLSRCMEASTLGTLDRSTCSATSNRAWITFQDVSVDSAVPVDVAKSCPTWALAYISAIGMRRDEMVKEKRIDCKDYTEAAFSVLANAIGTDPLGPLFVARYDIPLWSATQKERTRMECGAAFAVAIRRVVLAGVAEEPAVSAPSAPPSRNSSQAVSCRRLRLLYAEAVVRLAVEQARLLKKLGQVYGSECAIYADTVERTFLKRALKRRGVKATFKDDGVAEAMSKPLVFPPLNSQCHSPSSACMLEFGKPRT